MRQFDLPLNHKLKLMSRGVTFTTYGDIRRSQAALEIPNFRLPELSTGAMIIERAR